MRSSAKRFVRVLLILAVASLLPTPPGALAQEHVVSSADLHKDRVGATQARQSNQAKVEKFFTSEQAKKALKSAGISNKKIVQAVSQLGDEELARLAAQTEKIQRDFAAGTLTNQEITYILIALATAVVILVIVVA